MKLITHGSDPKQDLDLIRDRVNAVWAVDHDPQTGGHRFSETQTTVGAAGSASALPATPSGYVRATLADGTSIAIPYYASE
jgi:hypothetical protein